MAPKHHHTGSAADIPQGPRYFGTARTEILPHLPVRLSAVLDVGCGQGATIAAIRETRPDTPDFWAGGLELDPVAAGRAEAHCDRVWSGDVVASSFDREIAAGSLDAVLCLDVLEHLADPWDLVRRLTPLIGAGGRLIISVPNVRNWKFLWRLFSKGDFRYRDAGLLDRTHLRFFVRETAIELATCGGLHPVFSGSAHPFTPPDARWFLAKGTLGRLDDLMMKQIVVVAERSNANTQLQ
ncbi:MAG: methyltransferase [Pseudomonadota bacterium]